MLRWRLLLGTLLIATLVGLCYLDLKFVQPGWLLFPIAVLVAALGTHELIELLSACHIPPHPASTYAAVGLVLLGNLPYPIDVLPETSLSDFISTGELGTTLALATAGIFLVEIVRYRAPGKSMQGVVGGLCCVLYVGCLMSFVIQLRLLAPNLKGMIALISMIVVVKMCDTGAYTVGRLIGRHKMAPYVSPGKTWEGAAGGIAFAIFGAWITLAIWYPHALPDLPAISPLQIIIYGVVVGIAGMVGDLAESLIKREAGKKDSSSWMPGFGGVLDIIDSLLIAAPVAYLFWAWQRMQ